MRARQQEGQNDSEFSNNREEPTVRTDRKQKLKSQPEHEPNPSTAEEQKNELDETGEPVLPTSSDNEAIVQQAQLSDIELEGRHCPHSDSNEQQGTDESQSLKRSQDDVDELSADEQNPIKNQSPAQRGNESQSLQEIVDNIDGHLPEDDGVTQQLRGSIEVLEPQSANLPQHTEVVSPCHTQPGNVQLCISDVNMFVDEAFVERKTKAKRGERMKPNGCQLQSTVVLSLETDKIPTNTAGPVNRQLVIMEETVIGMPPPDKQHTIAVSDPVSHTVENQATRHRLKSRYGTP